MATHTRFTRSDVVTVICVLAFLTLCEVAVPEAFGAEYDRHLKTALLIVLAVGKAWLVALYFMHLKWEKPWLKYIALMPAYIAVASVFLMLESVFR